MATLAFSLLAVALPSVALPPPCDLEHVLARPMYPLPPGSGGASGLAASVRYPGWGWMVRDSDHVATLYAVRFRGAEGHLVREVPVVGARNVDWEEIVYATNRDGTGRLYVIESGQSGGERAIYKMGEPDPERALAVTNWARFRYAFPDGGNYNTEAAFFHQSRLVFVTKTNPARVYRFEERLSADRVNTPRFLGELVGSPRIAVARVSPDGRTLVTANRNYLWVYRAGRSDSDLSAFLGRPPDHTERITPEAGDNIKAGDFFPAGDCDLVLVAKSANVYRVLTHAEPVLAPVWPQRTYQRDAVPSSHAEVSGLAASRRFPGVMWAVRDSGNPASLYRLRPSSAPGRYHVREVPVRSASNSDWESLYYADEGAAGTFLYIHDNRGNRSNNPKRLYKVREPDPDGDSSASIAATYFWQFPRGAGTNTCGGRFNSEAITLFPLEDGEVTGRTRFYGVQKHKPHGRIYDFGPVHELSKSPTRPTRGALIGNLDLPCPSEFHVHPDNRSALIVQSGGGSNPGKVKVLEGDGRRIESLTRRNALVLLDHRDLFGEKGNTESATWWPWDGRNFQVLAESREGWLYHASP